MNDSVQRPLAVTTPLARGEDIGALQHAINRRLDARGSDYRVDEDHVFGPDTMDTGQIVAYILGVGTDKQDDLLSEYEQELVRDPDKRNQTQLERAGARRKLLDDLLEPHGGPQAVIKYALRFEGRTEKPAGSNRGPGIIDDCQTWALGYSGFFWCGAFVGYCAHKAAGCMFSKRNIVFTPAIVADAKGRRNGFAGWYSVRDAKPGDLALFNWPGGRFVDHVELVISNPGGGRLECIGGNTSKGGTNNNGGGIYRQVRQTGLAGVARPRYR
ncbi:MAG: CHAP domain-containing protein [Geodermatophilaceae bacterium]|jgi:hypothetical protein|nr:CHAP domain-containing protein [Geodermatophilaceae bacterium]MDQ3239990.1 hypothetical protein [Actinomycetota bacterium]